MTSDKHQPFEQNMRKEGKVKAQNIEGHSDEVGLHTGTNSIENDQVSTELRPCGWFKGTTMGSKNQNKKNKKASLDVKKFGSFNWLIKIFRDKIGGK